MKRRRIDQLFWCSGKGYDQRAGNGRSCKKHCQKKQATAEKHSRKKPVFVLADAIAQNADKPQKGNSGEGHQVQGESNFA